MYVYTCTCIHPQTCKKICDHKSTSLQMHAHARNCINNCSYCIHCKIHLYYAGQCRALRAKPLYEIINHYSDDIKYYTPFTLSWHRAFALIHYAIRKYKPWIDFSQGFWYSTLPYPIMYIQGTKLLVASMGAVELCKFHCRRVLCPPFPPPPQDWWP